MTHVSDTFLINFRGTGKQWYYRWICKYCGLKHVITNIMCSRCGARNSYIPYVATEQEKEDRS